MKKNGQMIILTLLGSALTIASYILDGKRSEKMLKEAVDEAVDERLKERKEEES